MGSQEYVAAPPADKILLLPAHTVAFSDELIVGKGFTVTVKVVFSWQEPLFPSKV